MSTLASGSKGTLIVDSVSNIGPHYARTLREWRRRFVERFENVVVPALQKEHELRRGGKGKKVLGRDEIEVFKRKWICNYRLQVFGFRVVVDNSVFQIITVTVKLGLRRGRWVVCIPELFIINVCAKFGLVDHIITFMREGNQDYGCDVYE